MNFYNRNLLITECPQPPKGDFVTSSIEFSHVKGNYFTYTRVKYACDEDHGLVWSEEDVLTCGSDGNWNSDRAPICGPSKLFFGV